MRKVFSLMALFAFLSSFAQNWCPPGATWTYEALHDNGGFIRMSYTGDTLIDGEVAQVIDMFSATQTGSSGGVPVYDHIPVARITKVEGHVVYVLQDQAWDTLYWFNASPGHSYAATHEPCSPFVILDDGIEWFDGIPLRWHSVGPIHRIYERMGYTWHIELACPPPWNIILDPAALRCYSDDQISVQLRAEDCEALVGIEDLQAHSTPTLHPNPGSDRLYVEPAQGVLSIQMLDALGRWVHNAPITASSIAIDTSLLPGGTYLVLTTYADARRQVQRWMKE
jgi:hypothetical protein